MQLFKAGEVDNLEVDKSKQCSFFKVFGKQKNNVRKTQPDKQFVRLFSQSIVQMLQRCHRAFTLLQRLRRYRSEIFVSYAEINQFSSGSTSPI